MTNKIMNIIEVILASAALVFVILSIGGEAWGIEGNWPLTVALGCIAVCSIMTYRRLLLRKKN